MAEFNIPSKNVEGKKIKPEDIQRGNNLVASKAAFVLQGFGLQRLKAQFFSPIEDPSAGTNIALSALGTPVFNALDINAGSFLPLDGGEAIAYEGLFLDTVLMDVSQTKNIVKTMLTGRNGTIKEYISNGDYEINIRGAVVSPRQEVYPEEEVEALINAFSVPDSIKIYSDYLQLFGIDEVVVESFTLPEREGFRNMQLFQARLVQDIPVILST